MNKPLSPVELANIDGYWRASNYLSVGQIYLLENPLLREPLKREHVKPRLLGHWGTSPGLNLIYVHLNRVIAAHDLNVLFITGPGHGGPSLVAHAYLEGTYTEVYPNVTEDEGGMKKLFTQFSFPGGIPSHVAPETPGSIHEGGELGYALSHAFPAEAPSASRLNSSTLFFLAESDNSRMESFAAVKSSQSDLFELFNHGRTIRPPPNNMTQVSSMNLVVGLIPRSRPKRDEIPVLIMEFPLNELAKNRISYSLDYLAGLGLH